MTSLIELELEINSFNVHEISGTSIQYIVNCHMIFMLKFSDLKQFIFQKYKYLCFNSTININTV